MLLVSRGWCHAGVTQSRPLLGILCRGLPHTPACGRDRRFRGPTIHSEAQDSVGPPGPVPGFQAAFVSPPLPGGGLGRCSCLVDGASVSASRLFSAVCVPNSFP